LRGVADWLSVEHADVLGVGLELADVVAELKMDMSSVLAGLMYRCVREDRISEAALLELVGQDSANIALAVANLATSSLLEMSNSPLLEKEQQDQVENIKRMLVSLIKDPRVAVVKLAERVTVLRRAKNYDPQRRRRIAAEASGVFAPLAGRLGIWQLKWELEDLALRYTHEQIYKQIAKQLQAKRAQRELQVELMIDQVRGLLRGHGIEAAVYGRAKHIYSIWRKMHAKGVELEQVHDVRAVRVVVDNLAQCYAALGVLHSTWQHIPSEFDDYIANPKENGYQSIHTAVTATDGSPLEIQIRTASMHQDAELGVCAHWSYKEGITEDKNYAAKMDWLRQVIEWHEDLGGTTALSTLLQHGASEERIYVSTPKGHVLELHSGATGLDFAYRVHTDIGHSCASVLVNGELAPLHRRLETGQQVEVNTREAIKPQRDWLEKSLGLVYTDRARAKLFNYFRQLDTAEQYDIGYGSLAAKWASLGHGTLQAEQLEALAKRVKLPDPQALCVAVGSGQLSAIETLSLWFQNASEQGQGSLPGIESHSLTKPVRFRLRGANRDGLLHDITQVISELKIPLTGTTGRVSNPPQSAIITVDVLLADWSQGVKFVSCLSLIDGVAEIRRINEVSSQHLE